MRPHSSQSHTEHAEQNPHDPIHTAAEYLRDSVITCTHIFLANTLHQYCVHLNLLVYGIVFHRAKEFSAAIERYTLALGFKPNNAPLHSNRAAAYMKLGLWAEAEQDCSYALVLEPHNFKALLRRCNARLELKDGAGALADAELAQEVEGTNSPELQAAETKARKLLRLDGKKNKIVIEEVSDDEEAGEDARDTSAGARNDQRNSTGGGAHIKNHSSPRAAGMDSALASKIPVVSTEEAVPTRSRIKVVVVGDSSSCSSLDDGPEEVEDEFFDALTMSSSEADRGMQLPSSSQDGVSAESGSGSAGSDTPPAPNDNDTAWGSGGASPTHGASQDAAQLDLESPQDSDTSLAAVEAAAASAAVTAAELRAAATAAAIAAVAAAAALAAFTPAPSAPAPAPVQETLQAAAAALKDEGNVLFAKPSYVQAARKYTDAIALMPTNSALYNNRSLARFNMDNAKGALEDAAMAVALEDSSVGKTLLRRANAKRKLGYLEVGLLSVSICLV